MLVLVQFPQDLLQQVSNAGFRRIFERKQRNELSLKTFTFQRGEVSNDSKWFLKLKNFLLSLREAANEFEMMIHLTIPNCNKQLKNEKKIHHPTYKLKQLWTEKNNLGPTYTF
jgi:hypothetical protein